jgi:transcriptional regulator with XRE-family HTH domain
MDLALDTDISVKHLSFLENNRANPSREMVLRLASTLQMSLKVQNALLVAAGYSPNFHCHNFDHPSMANVRIALKRILDQQEPYPAMVMDVFGEQLMVNQGALSMISYFIAPEIMLKYANAYELYLAKDGLLPFVKNWQDAASSLLVQLQSEVILSQDATGQKLLNKILNWEHIPSDWHHRINNETVGPMFVFEMEKEHTQLKFFTTLTTFGTPQDVNLQQLRIECFFPTDENTRVWFESRINR